MWQNARTMEPTGESPGELIDGIKFTIFRRRIGQIALAVILAESCIRYLSALVWYLIIPIISNVLATHTESVLFSTRRNFPWEMLIGNTIEFATAIIFVFYANRWIYRLSKPPQRNEEHSEEQMGLDEEALVPRLLSAPEASRDYPQPSTKEEKMHTKN